MAGTHSNDEVNAAINQEYNGVVSTLVGYDDIQGNAGGGTLHPTLAPTWTLHDYGIAGGVEFMGLGFAVDNVQFFTMQTPHSMKLQTILEQHLHFTLSSTATSGKFQFKLDVIAAGVKIGASNGVWNKPASSPFTSEVTIDTDLSGTHSLMELGDIEASNPTVSSLYKMRLERIDATSDEYGGLVFVEFFDGHFQKDQPRGSISEYNKFE